MMENAPHISSDDQSELLDIARSSLIHGLTHNKAVTLPEDSISQTLKEPAASFVTLENKYVLRGCVGSIEAHRPLWEDVAENAFNAGFRDPRFSPIQEKDLDNIRIKISILTPSVPMHFSSEDDLKQQLVPGEDGLILTDGFHRGLFLPSVWGQLPNRDDFLRHLKQKAGLPKHHWSETIQVQRFYTYEFSDADD